MLNCNLVLAVLPQLLIYVKIVWVHLELLSVHEKEWLFAWRVGWRLKAVWNSQIGKLCYIVFCPLDHRICDSHVLTDREMKTISQIISFFLYHILIYVVFKNTVLLLHCSV